MSQFTTPDTPEASDLHGDVDHNEPHWKSDYYHFWIAPTAHLVGQNNHVGFHLLWSVARRNYDDSGGDQNT